MNKLMILGMVLMFSAIANAQKIKASEVPTAVRVTFKKQYPTATKVKWEKENGQYEVNFDLNEVDYSLLINADGKIIETEIEITLNQLPAGILEYVRAHYAGQKIKKASKITDANGVVTYEAEIKGKDLIFDNNGKFIKETKD